MASFTTDLHWVENARQRIVDNYYPRIAAEGKFVSIGNNGGSLWLQKNAHIDTIIATPNGSALVEEKIVRWKGRAYTALAVETHSCLENNPDDMIGDGWIATSHADYLLYAFEQADASLLVWVFDLPLLRGWFYDNAHLYRNADTPNSHWVTRCRVVPLKDIPDHIIKTSNKAV